MRKIQKKKKSKNNNNNSIEHKNMQVQKFQPTNTLIHTNSHSRLFFYLVELSNTIWSGAYFIDRNIINSCVLVNISNENICVNCKY